VSLLEQELLSLPENLISSPVRGAQYLGFCVLLCRLLFVFFVFWHCIVCSYGLLFKQKYLAKCFLLLCVYLIENGSYILYEELEDTKGITRSRKPHKNRQKTEQRRHRERTR
jgi:hypothetical protein